MKTKKSKMFNDGIVSSPLHIEKGIPARHKKSCRIGSEGKDGHEILDCNCGVGGTSPVVILSNPQDNSESRARAQLESITEMVKALIKAQSECGNNASHPAQNDLEEAEEAIHSDALSVEVRSEWYLPSQLPDAQKPAEYMILLCTGGPAVRIIGLLDEHIEPCTARIEHQDWGTPWTEMRLTSTEQETVLTYCQCFYFGEE